MCGVKVSSASRSCQPAISTKELLERLDMFSHRGEIVILVSHYPTHFSFCHFAGLKRAISPKKDSVIGYYHKEIEWCFLI